jgi:hypothetical protein
MRRKPGKLYLQSSVDNASTSEAIAFQDDCEFMFDLFPNAFVSEEAPRPSSSFVPWPLANPSTSDAATLDNGLLTNIGSSEELSLLKLLDSADVGSLVSLNDPVFMSSVETQTKFVLTADGDSQTPNRNSCLDFCANKCTQTLRHVHQVETEAQTESIIGPYEGRLRIPAGVTRERLVAAVIDNPYCSTRFLARQLATCSSSRLVDERALGLLELLTDVVAATQVFIRGRLQEVVNDALLSNPTGETVLGQCAQYLNRDVDRSVE